MADDDSEERRKRRDEFHMELGYCVAAWAGVDDRLFRIFRDCVGPYDQSAVIYYRTPGLDARLNLTTEIVRTTLLPSWERPGNTDPRIKAWKDICKEFHKLLPIRRRIAHHPVRTDPFRYYISEPDGELAIQVGEHERLRDSQANLPPLRLRQLTLHRLGVEGLRQKLGTFYEEVLIKPPEAPLPPGPTVPQSDRRRTDHAPRRTRRRRSSPQ
jgi:hypothetical protein